ATIALDRDLLDVRDAARRGKGKGRTEDPEAAAEAGAQEPAPDRESAHEMAGADVARGEVGDVHVRSGKRPRPGRGAVCYPSWSAAPRHPPIPPGSPRATSWNSRSIRSIRLS